MSIFNLVILNSLSSCQFNWVFGKKKNVADGQQKKRKKNTKQKKTKKDGAQCKFDVGIW